MLKYFLTLISLCALLLQFSCDEVPPFIDLEEPDPSLNLLDTSYILSTVPQAQEKKIIVEDFSGIRCVNCPNGNTVVEELIDAYDGRVIGMTLHAGGFAEPRPQSLDTFKISETQAIADFLNIVSYPSAAIDRFKFDSDKESITTLSFWTPLTIERLEATTPVNLELENTFFEETKQVRSKVKITYTKEMADESHNISIFLLESGIIDYQETNDPDVPSGKIENYEHNHVVRAMMTPALGTALGSTEIVPGLTIEREFITTLRSKWIPENMEVVAFVHNTGDSKEILQAVEEHIE